MCNNFNDFSEDGAPVIFRIRHQKKLLPLNFFQEASCFHQSMEWTPLRTGNKTASFCVTVLCQYTIQYQYFAVSVYIVAPFLCSTVKFAVYVYSVNFECFPPACVTASFTSWCTLRLHITLNFIDWCCLGCCVTMRLVERQHLRQWFGFWQALHSFLDDVFLAIAMWNIMQSYSFFHCFYQKQSVHKQIETLFTTYYVVTSPC